MSAHPGRVLELPPGANMNRQTLCQTCGVDSFPRIVVQLMQALRCNPHLELFSSTNCCCCCRGVAVQLCGDLLGVGGAEVAHDLLAVAAVDHGYRLFKPTIWRILENLHVSLNRAVHMSLKS